MERISFIKTNRHISNKQTSKKFSTIILHIYISEFLDFFGNLRVEFLASSFLHQNTPRLPETKKYLQIKHLNSKM